MFQAFDSRAPTVIQAVMYKNANVHMCVPYELTIHDLIDAHTENALKLNVVYCLSAKLSQLANSSDSESAFEVPVMRTAIDE